MLLLDGLFIARHVQHVVPSRLTAGAAVKMPNEDTMIQAHSLFLKIELVFASFLNPFRPPFTSSPALPLPLQAVAKAQALQLPMHIVCDAGRTQVRSRDKSLTHCVPVQ